MLEVLTAVLVALLPYPTINEVVLPPPPIDMGLLGCALPMPTPLTLEPETAKPLAVLMAALTALHPYPTTIDVALPLPAPIDTGQLEYG